MSVKIEEVKDKTQWNDYVDLPLNVNAGNTYFSPGLKIHEKNINDTKTNPSVGSTEHKSLVAYKDGICCGRVTGIIDPEFNNVRKRRSVKFFQPDFIEDHEVSGTLFDHLARWGREKGMTELIGPFGYTARDKKGLLIKGITTHPVYNEPCEYTYVPTHIHEYGIDHWWNYITYKLMVPDAASPGISAVSEWIGRSERFSLIDIAGKEDMRKWIEKIRIFYNENASFEFGRNEISFSEAEFIVRNYSSLVRAEDIHPILDNSSKLAALAITMKNRATKLHETNGESVKEEFKLFDLKKKKKQRTDVLLFMVDKKYRGLGLEVKLLGILNLHARRSGSDEIFFPMIFESNRKARSELVKLGATEVMTHRIFRIPL